MINTVKVQQDFIKECLKGTQAIFAVDELINRTFIGNGKAVYYIPQDELLLRCLNAKPLNITKMLDISDCDIGLLAGIEKVDKGLLMDLTTEDAAYHVFIDDKFMKPIKHYDNILIKGPKAPVFVIEDDKIIAMIMPVARGGKKND